MSRRIGLFAGAALVAAALVAGCGGSDDSTATSSTPATDGTATTDTIESDLQARLDDAAQSCTDAAGQISNSTLKGAAEAACDQLKSSLADDIASAADDAKGNASAALDNLAADCREAAGNLPAGGDIASSFCDAISASSDSVSG
ncbi:MAG: hypothetical protein U0R24_03705 [Solirubrobacterales bacterium]